MSTARRSWKPSDDHGTWGRRLSALASTAGLGTVMAFVAFGSMRAGFGTREAGAEFGGSWQQAQADAVARGGHLMTITSQSEWNFAWANIPPHQSGGTVLGGYQLPGSAEPGLDFHPIRGHP